MSPQRRRSRLGTLTRSFAVRLGASREERGWSRHTLAIRSGLTRPRILNLEQGVQQPRLHEIEQLAKTLGVDIAALLGIHGRPEATVARPEFPRETLTSLAELLREASDSLVEFIQGFPRTAARTTTVAAAPRAVKPAPAPLEAGSVWQWDRILPVAQRLLEARPSRAWKPVQLCQAIKAAGLELRTARGLHFAIVPRLREAGFITEKPDGTFSFRALEAAGRATSRRKRAHETSASRAPASRESKPEPTATHPGSDMEALVAAATALLDAHRDRVWKPKPFADAVRATGIALKNWRGIYLSLPKLLGSRGLIRVNGDGTFAAPSQATPAAPTPRVAAREPADPALLSLGQEIEQLAPRLAGMTPRERTAQLAVWAGRTRQLEEKILARKDPDASSLRRTIRPIIVRLVALRKSLDCGWVDALSRRWSTDWKIYIEYNRAIAVSDTPALSVDQKKLYFQDALRSLLEIRRKQGAHAAPVLIIESSQVLDEQDPWLVDAMKTFGNHTDRRAAASSPGEPFQRLEDAGKRIQSANAVAKKQGIPKSVLKAARGKSLLIAGGPGPVEVQRLAVKKGLQLKSVDWITGERNTNPAELFSLAVRNKKYDFVLLMSGAALPDVTPLKAACKEVGASLFYLAGGPSVPAVAEAIFAHRVVGGRIPEWMETR